MLIFGSQFLLVPMKNSLSETIMEDIATEVQSLLLYYYEFLHGDSPTSLGDSKHRNPDVSYNERSLRGNHCYQRICLDK